MTRLFGCTCNQPQRIAEALEPIRHVLVATAPVPRWGLGSIQGGEVLLSRFPRPSDGDVDFFAALQNRHSDYLIAHASERDGLGGNANTQPLRFRQWMYAQEGSIEDFAGVQSEILARIPAFMRRNIAGKTAAEHLFHVFLAMLHEAGSIDDRNLPPSETRRVLAATMELASGVLKGAGSSARPGNVIVSNARSMLAARLGHPMYLRRLFVAGDDRTGRDETFRGVLVVSTTADPGEGFEEIPAGAAVLIHRDLRTDITPLDS